MKTKTLKKSAPDVKVKKVDFKKGMWYTIRIPQGIYDFIFLGGAC